LNGNVLGLQITPWNSVESVFGPVLLATDMFAASTPEGQRRFADLKKRVVEHNIRVLAKYYTRLTLPRLAQLLDLEPLVRARERKLCFFLFP
jgi:26S proteasome regulatory subunit N5